MFVFVNVPFKFVCLLRFDKEKFCVASTRKQKKYRHLHCGIHIYFFTSHKLKAQEVTVIFFLPTFISFIIIIIIIVTCSPPRLPNETDDNEILLYEKCQINIPVVVLKTYKMT